MSKRILRVTAFREILKLILYKTNKRVLDCLWYNGKIKHKDKFIEHS